MFTPHRKRSLSENGELQGMDSAAYYDDVFLVCSIAEQLQVIASSMITHLHVYLLP